MRYRIIPIRNFYRIDFSSQSMYTRRSSYFTLRIIVPEIDCNVCTTASKKLPKSTSLWHWIHVSVFSYWIWLDFERIMFGICEICVCDESLTYLQWKIYCGNILFHISVGFHHLLIRGGVFCLLWFFFWGGGGWGGGDGGSFGFVKNKISYSRKCWRKSLTEKDKLDVL